MEPTHAMQLDLGEDAGPRASPRKAALQALERLLRAHGVMGEERASESPFGLLRPAQDDDIALIEAAFDHCGVPLPDTLRLIYRRTLGVGNPVCSRPVLEVPFLHAALPDEGYGSPVVGLAAHDGNLDRDETGRPPALLLGRAGPLRLMLGRNGLCSLRGPAQGRDLTFESAFCALVDQVLLVWANDLAGDVVRERDLDVTQGARLDAMPSALLEARARLVAPRALSPRTWGEIWPLDNADLLRSVPRGENLHASGVLGSHVTVVGLAYSDRPEVAAHIGPGALLRLRPVDDNPYDMNAVEVWHDEVASARVGFVARRQAPGVRALPHGVPAWRLRVTGRCGPVLEAALERREGASEEASGAPARPATDEGRDLFSRDV